MAIRERVEELAHAGGVSVEGGAGSTGGTSRTTATTNYPGSNYEPSVNLR